MKRQTQRLISDNTYCRIHSDKQLVVICRSPYCGFYRELCEQCILTQQGHKEKFHLPIHLALPHVESRLKDIEKGILILKKQKQQKQKTNPITLPYEVKEKLENIRQIINEKISLFEKSLEQIYEKQVNMKLQSLSQTLKKSLDFLKRQQNQLQKNYDIHLNLKKYFVNFQYWDHQRKYYKSYMEQILEKQVMSFKEGFDDDNIMKLIVNFEINLKSIFSPVKESSKNQSIQRPHLFFEERSELKKYELVQRLAHEHYTIRPEFLGKPYPKENYKWIGKPQSIYYSDLDCFFIFGEGRTPSNAIVKYEDGRQNGNKKLSFIGQMYTKRSYFSTCLVNGQIFIVGGYNDKQGCMAKCEKMVMNPKVKIYLVSSLEQRSAFHSVCNYKNKFILKFGGTTINIHQNQNYHTQMTPKQLYPQIYDIEKQQWRVIRYHSHNAIQKLQFGLQPLIVIPYENDQNKIVVFGNKLLENFNEGQVAKTTQGRKKKFQIKLLFTRNDVEMKIVECYYDVNKKYEMFPETLYPLSKKNNWKVIAFDKTKYQNSLHLIDIQYEN